MTDTAIEVRGLTKRYKLYDKPIDRLKESLNPFKKRYHKDFYALDDVSFSIKKGETIGIIGKNGAGKSTLLKIITGVLTPTKGEVIVNGRISSLLELGAGFNPEYTGMENIYLQGTLMGYNREEMENKVDEILAFADIGDFIHQTVKMYSSGMFARLAFAVAINVEPDILIIDEALSVGDVRFQRKCFAKMEEISKRGVTIVFVSHDLETVKTFTEKALFILDGKLDFYSDSKTCAIRYLQYLFGKKEKETAVLADKNVNMSITESDSVVSLDKEKSKLNFGSGAADFEYLHVNGLNGNIFHGGEEIQIEYKLVWDIDKITSQFNIDEYQKNLIVGLHLIDKKGNTYFGLNTFLKENYINPFAGSEILQVIKFTMPYFMSGDYFLTVAVAYGSHENHTQLCWYDDGIELKGVSNKKHLIGFLDIPFELDSKVA